MGNCPQSEMATRCQIYPKMPKNNYWLSFLLHESKILDLTSILVYSSENDD